MPFRQWSLNEPFKTVFEASVCVSAVVVTGAFEAVVF